MTSSAREPVQIFLNDTNIVAGTNNSKMRYRFASGNLNLSGKEICIKSIDMIYSFPSVTASGGLPFTYTWIDGTVVTVTLEENGTYSAADINGLLQTTMIANGHYLLDATTGTIPYYFASFVENSVLYGIQYNSLPVPTSLGTLYAYPVGDFSWVLGATSTQVAVAANVLTVTQTNTYAPGDKVLLVGYGGTAAVVNGVRTVATASGASWTAALTTGNFTNNTGADQGQAYFSEAESPVWALPGSLLNPTLTIPSTPALNALIGFDAGSYPSSPTGIPYSVVSQNTPELNPVSVVLVNTNVVNNTASQFPGTILSFPVNVTYGQPLSPPIYQWSFYQCIPKQEAIIEITVTDQDGNPLVVLDPQWSLTIEIRSIAPNIEDSMSDISRGVRELVTAVTGDKGLNVPAANNVTSVAAAGAGTSPSDGFRLFRHLPPSPSMGDMISPPWHQKPRRSKVQL